MFRVDLVIFITSKNMFTHNLSKFQIEIDLQSRDSSQNVPKSRSRASPRDTLIDSEIASETITVLNNPHGISTQSDCFAFYLPHAELVNGKATHRSTPTDHQTRNSRRSIILKRNVNDVKPTRNGCNLDKRRLSRCIDVSNSVGEHSTKQTTAFIHPAEQTPLCRPTYFESSEMCTSSTSCSSGSSRKKDFHSSKMATVLPNAEHEYGRGCYSSVKTSQCEDEVRSCSQQLYQDIDCRNDIELAGLMERLSLSPHNDADNKPKYPPMTDLLPATEIEKLHETGKFTNPCREPVLHCFSKGQRPEHAHMKPVSKSSSVEMSRAASARVGPNYPLPVETYCNASGRFCIEMPGVTNRQTMSSKNNTPHVEILTSNLLGIETDSKSSTFVETSGGLISRTSEVPLRRNPGTHMTRFLNTQLSGISSAIMAIIPDCLKFGSKTAMLCNSEKKETHQRVCHPSHHCVFSRGNTDKCIKPRRIQRSENENVHNNGDNYTSHFCNVLHQTLRKQPLAVGHDATSTGSRSTAVTQQVLASKSDSNHGDRNTADGKQSSCDIETRNKRMDVIEEKEANTRSLYSEHQDDPNLIRATQRSDDEVSPHVDMKSCDFETCIDGCGSCHVRNKLLVIYQLSALFQQITRLSAYANIACHGRNNNETPCSKKLYRVKRVIRAWNAQATKKQARRNIHNRRPMATRNSLPRRKKADEKKMAFDEKTHVEKICQTWTDQEARTQMSDLPTYTLELDNHQYSMGDHIDEFGQQGRTLGPDQKARKSKENALSEVEEKYIRVPPTRDINREVSHEFKHKSDVTRPPDETETVKALPNAHEMSWEKFKYIIGDKTNGDGEKSPQLEGTNSKNEVGLKDSEAVGIKTERVKFQTRKEEKSGKEQRPNELNNIYNGGNDISERDDEEKSKLAGIESTLNVPSSLFMDSTIGYATTKEDLSLTTPRSPQRHKDDRDASRSPRTVGSIPLPETVIRYRRETAGQPSYQRSPRSDMKASMTTGGDGDLGRAEIPERLSDDQSAENDVQATTDSCAAPEGYTHEEITRSTRGAASIGMLAVGGAETCSESLMRSLRKKPTNSSDFPIEHSHTETRRERSEPERCPNRNRVISSEIEECSIAHEIQRCGRVSTVVPEKNQYSTVSEIVPEINDCSTLSGEETMLPAIKECRRASEMVPEMHEYSRVSEMLSEITEHSKASGMIAAIHEYGRVSELLQEINESIKVPRIVDAINECSRGPSIVEDINDYNMISGKIPDINELGRVLEMVPGIRECRKAHGMVTEINECSNVLETIQEIHDYVNITDINEPFGTQDMKERSSDQNTHLVKNIELLIDVSKESTGLEKPDEQRLHEFEFEKGEEKSIQENTSENVEGEQSKEYQFKGRIDHTLSSEAKEKKTVNAFQTFTGNKSSTMINKLGEDENVLFERVTGFDSSFEHFSEYEVNSIEYLKPLKPQHEIKQETNEGTVLHSKSDLNCLTFKNSTRSASQGLIMIDVQSSLDFSPGTLNTKCSSSCMHDGHGDEGAPLQITNTISRSLSAQRVMIIAHVRSSFSQDHFAHFCPKTTSGNSKHVKKGLWPLEEIIQHDKQFLGNNKTSPRCRNIFTSDCSASRRTVHPPFKHCNRLAEHGCESTNTSREMSERINPFPLIGSQMHTSNRAKENASIAMGIQHEEKGFTTSVDDLEMNRLCKDLTVLSNSPNGLKEGRLRNRFKNQFLIWTSKSPEPAKRSRNTAQSWAPPGEVNVHTLRARPMESTDRPIPISVSCGDVAAAAKHVTVIRSLEAKVDSKTTCVGPEDDPKHLMHSSVESPRLSEYSLSGTRAQLITDKGKQTPLLSGSGLTSDGVNPNKIKKKTDKKTVHFERHLTEECKRPRACSCSIHTPTLDHAHSATGGCNNVQNANSSLSSSNTGENNQHEFGIFCRYISPEGVCANEENFDTLKNNGTQNLTTWNPSKRLPRTRKGNKCYLSHTKKKRNENEVKKEEKEEVDGQAEEIKENEGGEAIKGQKEDWFEETRTSNHNSIQVGLTRSFLLENRNPGTPLQDMRSRRKPTRHREKPHESLEAGSHKRSFRVEIQSSDSYCGSSDRRSSDTIFEKLFHRQMQPVENGPPSKVIHRRMNGTQPSYKDNTKCWRDVDNTIAPRGAIQALNEDLSSRVPQGYTIPENRTFNSSAKNIFETTRVKRKSSVDEVLHPFATTMMSAFRDLFCYKRGLETNASRNRIRRQMANSWPRHASSDDDVHDESASRRYIHLDHRRQSACSGHGRRFNPPHLSNLLERTKKIGNMTGSLDNHCWNYFRSKKQSSRCPSGEVKNIGDNGLSWPNYSLPQYLPPRGGAFGDLSQGLFCSNVPKKLRSLLSPNAEMTRTADIVGYSPMNLITNKKRDLQMLKPVECYTGRRRRTSVERSHRIKPNLRAHRWLDIPEASLCSVSARNTDRNKRRTASPEVSFSRHRAPNSQRKTSTKRYPSRETCAKRRQTSPDFYPSHKVRGKGSETSSNIIYPSHKACGNRRRVSQHSRSRKDADIKQIHASPQMTYPCYRADIKRRKASACFGNRQERDAGGADVSTHKYSRHKGLISKARQLSLSPQKHSPSEGRHKGRQISPSSYSQSEHIGKSCAYSGDQKHHLTRSMEKQRIQCRKKKTFLATATPLRKDNLHERINTKKEVVYTTKKGIMVRLSGSDKGASVKCEQRENRPEITIRVPSGFHVVEEKLETTSEKEKTFHLSGRWRLRV